MTKTYDQIAADVRDALIAASSTFREDKKIAFRKAIAEETNDRAKWLLQTMLDNALVAEETKRPLCDDTGIPHLILDIGPHAVLDGQTIDAVYEGVAQGLRLLPGRPMAVVGDDLQRLDQSGGISDRSDAVEAAPLLIRRVREEGLRLHLLMFGGGPEIRGKTYRVFHLRDRRNIVDEIVAWAVEGIADLGCSPCTLAVGIGRSHFEATALMLEAHIDGNYLIQSEVEREITRRINASDIGPVGLRGDTTVLATFVKIGPQRASGVRIVSVRPSCSVEPRWASVDLEV